MLSRLMISGRKIARNVKAMATGETSAEVDTTELPEFVKNLQETVRILNSHNLVVKIEVCE